jgi:molecular chaperone Hsp33
MQTLDIRQRWIFENLPIRGTVVYLDQVLQEAWKTRTYTPQEQRLLAEALLGVCLLGGIGKQTGKLLLQFQGTGDIRLLSAQATQQGKLRAALQTSHGKISAQALHQGTLSVIYQPDQIKEHRQSIVEAKPQGLLPSIAHYFDQSEQIPTCLQAFEDAGRYAAFIWQILPHGGPQAKEEAIDFIHAIVSTLTAKEVFSKQLSVMLMHLFPTLEIRLFEEEALTYGCENERTRMENAILSLGKQEAFSILDEQTHISLSCEFCGQTSLFDRQEVEQLFSPKIIH